MTPETNAKQINVKLSKDIPANLFTLMLIGSFVVYSIINHGFSGTGGIRFALVIGVLLFQVASHFIPKVKDWPTFHSGGAGALANYNIAMILLFAWFIPIYSPFLLIFAAVMFITIYYRGVLGFFISVASLIVAVFLSARLNGTPDVAFGYLYPYFAVFIGVAYAGILQRLSAMDSDVRNEYERVSDKVELDDQQLNSLIGNMTDAILAADKDGNILFHNEAATKLLDKDLPHGSGTLSSVLSVYDRPGKEVNILELAKSANARIKPKGLHLVTPKEGKINLFLDISPIKSSLSQKSHNGFIIMMRDITKEESMLEDKIKERTVELEHANKEMESFSYSVSHDLRAPLRAISGFSKILTEDYGTKLDADGKRIVQTIADSTSKMETLISDILAFSRLGHGEVKKQPVGMTELAKSVFEDIKQINPNRKIHIHFDDLPAISADPSLLREVWINLLANAVKFTNKKTLAKIELRSTSDSHNVTYFVKDNGAGFDMAYGDKLFGVFQRLHTESEFEGTGIGLAVIKKIISRHGGKVWAEGEVNKGATIYFSLPKTEDTEKKG